MSWKNLARAIGLVGLVAMVVGFPLTIFKIIAIWWLKNLVIMAVLIALTFVGGAYLLYLDVRYIIVQYYQKMF